METNRKSKKGFWTSLFSPRHCSCGGSQIVVEESDGPSGSCCCGNDSGGTKETGNACGDAAGKIKEVKVLGPGCAKCKAAYGIMERVIKANGLDVRLTKVDDVAEMMAYNIMSTPAVVVDGVVRLKGRVPTEAEAENILAIR